ncbi:uncharacterized protein BDCG_06569 [Blastomyces dermatitidis ER-3]|uniref:Uncharacterized protein n=3 Tax=Blastomyces TaxID=229219 RepID=A0A179UQN1_BLAGS|nr:uncharacterized protein BDBG_05148 [Blastomyces gilchristii SLH14081]XP_045277986.1 uncharacterized protein BDCG_06569 [Blastomyces dermatitidis ER-3]EEQ91449.1 hypothetical protein BDCG_06569 [Blastomyces dermatitidis ER-3]EGE80329.1 hypothetical protein BDDG_03270 [Blastomyces dermatitidis ATCC 18188]OAT09351.1 hypothetical protein BDBG_05148 [Blastomyces gilchristii SLH14081]
MAAIRADGAKGTAIPFPQKKFCDPEYGEPPDWPNENPEGSLYVPCMSTPPTAAERQASRPADKKIRTSCILLHTHRVRPKGHTRRGTTRLASQAANFMIWF